MKRVIFFLLTISSVAGMASTGISEAEKQALIAFYESTNGDQWTRSWDLNASVEDWQGVVTQNGKVVELNLFNNNLRKVARVYGPIKI